MVLQRKQPIPLIFSEEKVAIGRCDEKASFDDMITSFGLITSGKQQIDDCNGKEDDFGADEWV